MSSSRRGRYRRQQKSLRRHRRKGEQLACEALETRTLLAVDVFEIDGSWTRGLSPPGTLSGSLSVNTDTGLVTDLNLLRTGGIEEGTGIITTIGGQPILSGGTPLPDTTYDTASITSQYIHDNSFHIETAVRGDYLMVAYWDVPNGEPESFAGGPVSFSFTTGAQFATSNPGSGTLSPQTLPTNNPPSNVALTDAVNTILENADTSSAIRIAGIDVTDDELGSNVVNLSGPDASSFYYTAGFGGAFGGGFAQGSVYLNPGIELDAATKPSFQFTVEVSDTSLPGSDPVTVDHTLTVLNVNDVPTGSVTIAGTPRDAEVLTASNTLADADGLGPISYQWKRDTVAINGATNSTYTLVQADVGAAITVTASYTDQGGTNESVTSAATTAVVDAAGNQAPVLDPAASPQLDSVAENAGVPVGPVGALVSDLVDVGGTHNNFNDSDGDLPGIAITGVNLQGGVLWYSSDDGSTWLDVGAVSDEAPRLLAADGTTRVYFQPAADFIGTVSDVISFRAWDRNILLQQLGSDILSEPHNYCVSISADGRTVAIGSPFRDDNKGMIQVYTWNGSAWNQLGADIHGEATGDFAGNLSISADGRTVAIGSYVNDGNGDDSGHVRVYHWAESEWSQVGADIDGEAAGDMSGFSVSLSADGQTVAIGAANTRGRVSIYSWVDDSWTKLGASISGKEYWDYSGHAVSLSADGQTVAIGAPADGSETPGDAQRYPGYVHIYRWDGSIWNQLGADLFGQAITDMFGHAVSLSADGQTVAIGARLSNGMGESSGHVSVYSWTGSAWNQLGADIDGEAAGDNSGWSVSLSADGQTVAIGAYSNDGGGENSGQVRLYSWSGSGWNQLGPDIDGDSSYASFSHSLSLSSDGQSFAASHGGGALLNPSVKIYVIKPELGSLSTTIDTMSVTVDLANNSPSNVELTDAVNTILETADTSSAIRIAGIDVTDDELGSNVVNLSGPDASSFYYTAGFGGAFGGGFAQGGVYLNPGIELEAATKPSFQFTVEVSDTSLPGSDPVTVDHTLTVLNVNDLPTGSVTITGTAREDEVLTASNTLADADGLGAISYQWKRDGIAISGATNSTYTLVQADVGAAITVTASYTDQGGTNESVTSPATAEVLNVNDIPTLDELTDVSMNEDDSQQTQSLSGITAGDGEVQVLLVTAASDNPGLIPDPAVTYTSPDTTGSIAFTPVADQSGTATLTITVTDGGLDNDLATTEDNGTTTRTIVVNVAPVNDLPTIEVNGAFSIRENAPLRTLDLTAVSAGGGESQPLRVTAVNDNTNLIPDLAVNYSTPDTTGNLTFTPTANQHGTTTITVTIEDGGFDNDLETSGDNEIFSRAISIVVAEINEAPALDPTALPAFDNVIEDAGAPSGPVGTLVDALVDTGGTHDNFSDSNGDLPGIAITRTNLQGGKLWYSTDNGSTWHQADAVSDFSALGLYANGSTRLYFEAHADFSGSIRDVISFKAWDRSTGYSAGVANGSSLTLPGGLVGSLYTPGSAWSVTVAADGHHAFVADASSGLTILDVKDRTAPNVVSNIDTAGILMDLAISPDEMTAYVSNSESRIDIFDISELSNPTLLTSLTMPSRGLPTGLQVSDDGKHLFIADRSVGLIVANVTDRTSPFIESSNATAGGATGLIARGSIASIIDRSDKFYLFDIAAPSAPIQLSEIVLPEVAHSVVINSTQTYAYVALDSLGLQVIDISDPTNPVLGMLMPVPVEDASIRDIVLSSDDNFGYVVDAARGVHILDTSEIAHPYIIESYETRGTPNATAITPDGQSLVIADGSGGVSTVNLLEEITSSQENKVSVTVDPVNDTPTLDAIHHVKLRENDSDRAVRLTGITAGGEENQAIRVTAQSDNTNLIPHPHIKFNRQNSYGFLTFTPQPDQYGVATVTIMVEDSGFDGDFNTAEDNASHSQTFKVIVTPRTKDAPSPIADRGKVFIHELLTGDGADPYQLPAMNVNGEAINGLVHRITATSTNRALVPDPTVTYAGTDIPSFLSLSRPINSYGTSTLSIQVEDGGLDNDFTTLEDNRQTTHEVEVHVLDIISRESSTILAQDTLNQIYVNKQPVTHEGQQAHKNIFDFAAIGTASTAEENALLVKRGSTTNRLLTDDVWKISSMFHSLANETNQSLDSSARDVVYEFPAAVRPGKTIGNLPEQYETSGLTWHDGLQKLFAVSDEGIVSMMNADGTDLVNWNVPGDLEALTVADHTSNLIYIGVENPDSILEFDIITGQVTRTFDLTNWMTGADNQGLEALAFVPDVTHPEGGLFYAGLQSDGHIYQFALPIVSNSSSNAVTFVQSMAIEGGSTDLAGLAYDPSSELLLAMFDSIDQLNVIDRDGQLKSRWTVPGTGQEAVIFVDGQFYIGDDSLFSITLYSGFDLLTD